VVLRSVAQAAGAGGAQERRWRTPGSGAGPLGTAGSPLVTRTQCPAASRPCENLSRGHRGGGRLALVTPAQHSPRLQIGTLASSLSPLAFHSRPAKPSALLLIRHRPQVGLPSRAGNPTGVQPQILPVWRETLPTLRDVITRLYLGEGLSFPPSSSLQIGCEILPENPSSPAKKKDKNK
jgi:hypothetical protein